MLSSLGAAFAVRIVIAVIVADSIFFPGNRTRSRQRAKRGASTRRLAASAHQASRSRAAPSVRALHALITLVLALALAAVAAAAAASERCAAEYVSRAARRAAACALLASAASVTEVLRTAARCCCCACAVVSRPLFAPRAELAVLARAFALDATATAAGGDFDGRDGLAAAALALGEATFEPPPRRRPLPSRAMLGALAIGRVGVGVVVSGEDDGAAVADVLLLAAVESSCKRDASRSSVTPPNSTSKAGAAAAATTGAGSERRAAAADAAEEDAAGAADERAALLRSPWEEDQALRSVEASAAPAVADPFAARRSNG